MDWEKAYRDIISNYSFRESQWKFETSAGLEGSFTSPGAKVGIAATGGAIWVKEGANGKSTKLRYGGAGPTGGFGNLIATPINFSISLPAMHSSGTIYKLPAAGKGLSLSEMRGAFLAVQVSGDVGAGWTEALIFMGGDFALAAAAGPLSTLVLLASSKALLWFGGMSATAVPYNIGATAYVGMIA